jgi:hypothetical protein
MARQEHEREDLFAEATALVQRVELTMPGEAEPIVIGARRDGCLSLYFDADHAYHFNTRYELRRAYLNGRLIKAEGGRLIALTRQRAEGEVQLVPEVWSPGECATLVTEVSARIATLRAGILANQCAVLRQAPAEWRALETLAEWLAPLVRPFAIAAAPHAG